jgi:HlyD family secretion protein
MKRIAIAGVLLVAALAGWAGWHYSDASRAIVAKVVEYFWGPTLPLGFASGNGRIEATQYDIATKHAGRIAEVLVREGDMVRQDQFLARMDTKDLDSVARESFVQAPELEVL